MKLTVLISSLLMLFCACQTPENGIHAQIEALEEELKQREELDTGLAGSITDLYLSYADQYPNDSLSPHYLSRAADIYKEVPGKRLKAVNIYNEISRLYPDHPITPRSIFMVGYVFDEYFKDEERATKTYRHFLQKYPEHPLAGDARNLLALLEDTLSQDEVVNRWLEQSKADTNQTNRE